MAPTLNVPGKKGKLAGQVSAAQGVLQARSQLNKPQLTATAGMTKPAARPGATVMRDGNPVPGAQAPRGAQVPQNTMQAAPSSGYQAPPSFQSAGPTLRGGGPPNLQAASTGLQAGNQQLPPRLQEAVAAGRMTPEGAANRYQMFQQGQLPGQMGGSDDRQMIDPRPQLFGGQSVMPGGMQYGSQEIDPRNHVGRTGGYPAPPGYGQIPPEMMMRLQGNAQNAQQMGYPGGGIPPQLMARLQQDPRFAQLMQQAPPNLGMYYGR